MHLRIRHPPPAPTPPASVPLPADRCQHPYYFRQRPLLRHFAAAAAADFAKKSPAAAADFSICTSEQVKQVRFAPAAAVADFAAAVAADARVQWVHEIH